MPRSPRPLRPLPSPSRRPPRPPRGPPRPPRPAPQVINGRAAMLGFLAAVGAELATQDSIFKQLGEGGAGGMLFVFAAVTAASFAPIFNGQDAQKSFLKNSQPEEFGPFNAQAEMLNGRAAMMGLLFLLAAEASQGQAFF